MSRLEILLKFLRTLLQLSAPPDPKPFGKITLINEVKNPMKYDVELPPFPAPAPNTKDIVSQKFTFGYTDPVSNQPFEEVRSLLGIIDAQGNATVPDTHTIITVPEDTSVNLQLVYLDDDGLSSKNAAKQTFKSGDTIPPSDPGDFGALTLITEEPTPEPEPEPEPQPEL